MKFGENLKKLRKVKSISQEELANKMKVSRQSVSKWETGDAYPEMNNILELCKIFHCRINDLVNDSILDADSLDEEIKENVVKLKKEQQSKMKFLSKCLTILAKIGKIVSLVCIPILVITMIFTSIAISKIDVDNNEIIWNNSKIISIEEENDKLCLKFDDTVIADISEQDDISMIKYYLANNNKVLNIVYVDVGFICLIGFLALVYVMLKYLEKLFSNINMGDTPFTLENVGYIKKMAYLMIALTVLPNVLGIIFEMILRTDLNIEFEMFSLVEILFLFSIAYIFQYGYEIQLDSKGKMYDDDLIK